MQAAIWMARRSMRNMPSRMLGPQYAYCWSATRFPFRIHIPACACASACQSESESETETEPAVSWDDETWREKEGGDRDDAERELEEHEGEGVGGAAVALELPVLRADPRPQHHPLHLGVRAHAASAPPEHLHPERHKRPARVSTRQHIPPALSHTHCSTTLPYTPLLTESTRTTPPRTTAHLLDERTERTGRTEHSPERKQRGVSTSGGGCGS
eukprot:472577-Rhodomonas_salina.1